MAILLAGIELIVIMFLVWWLHSVRRERGELRRAYERIAHAVHAGESTFAIIRQANILPRPDELPRRGVGRSSAVLITAMGRRITDRPLVTVTSVAMTGALVIAMVVVTQRDGAPVALSPSNRLGVPRLLAPLPEIAEPALTLPAPPPQQTSEVTSRIPAVTNASASAHGDSTCCTSHAAVARAVDVEPAAESRPTLKVSSQRTPAVTEQRREKRYEAGSRFARPHGHESGGRYRSEQGMPATRPGNGRHEANHGGGRDGSALQDGNRRDSNRNDGSRKDGDRKDGSRKGQDGHHQGSKRARN